MNTVKKGEPFFTIERQLQIPHRNYRLKEVHQKGKHHE
jgi:hypothetical protein